MKEKVYYTLNVKHYEGLNIKESANCLLKLTNYELQLCDIKKRPIKNIALNDIVNVAILSDKELIEKDKSVIARGIVGDVLFGGIGLILGGLSGIGKKQVGQNIDYLIINYKENGEDKVINVYANSGILSNGFMKGLNYAIDSSKKEIKCPKCGNVVNFGDYKCSKCGNVLKDTKKLKSVFGIIIGIFIFIFIIIGIAMSVSGSNSKEVNIIKRVVNVEVEEAKEINSILDSVGLNEFEDMKADNESLNGFEGEGSKGYRIKTSFSDNVILYLDSNNKVISIRYADTDYYRNGQVLKTFEN